MGQEQSGLIGNDVQPETLSERSLAAVAERIKAGKANKIVVLTGAGISTAAGIPDFRSPQTGLYANLQRLNLPYAEAVFDISFFREKPEPFYVLAKELYPGQFHPTISHVFISLLAKKNLLHMLFTQNIDCLERRAGVPDDLIVEAHGSFATQRCIECRDEYPDADMRKHVEAGQAPHCPKCNGLVKPDIVFFGEQLPPRFLEESSRMAEGDLCLILGTSLSVHPFASLPSLILGHVPRVLFNLERVRDLGTRPDDVLALGGCDEGIRALAKELCWEGELEAEWRRIVGDEEADRQLSSKEKRDTAMGDEVSKLADEVEDVLKLGRDTEADLDQAEPNKTAEKSLVVTTERSNEATSSSPASDAVSAGTDRTEKAPQTETAPSLSLQPSSPTTKPDDKPIVTSTGGIGKEPSLSQLARDDRARQE